VKILVLTSIYKGPDIPSNFTPVVHYFAKEWNIKNTVIVIHNLAYYHRIFYLASFFFGKIIANLTGTNVPEKRLTQIIKYKIDGVNVYRLPIYKPIPFLKFSNKTLKNHNKLILKVLKNANFTPDVAIGHWGNPQLKLLEALKSENPKIQTLLTLHYDGEKLYRTYYDSFKNDLKYIDLIGFRNISDRNSFQRKHKSLSKKTFICPSGLPKSFFLNKRSVSSNFKNFIFIGTLIKRKYPNLILDVLYEIFKSEFTMTFIGSGFLIKNIKKTVKKYNLTSVLFHNKLSRDEVISKLDIADCLIMISEDEAFGLVYLEAMARGCIVIASLNEGMDGIIVDGQNGFLCKSGDKKDLTKKLKYISQLTNEELIKVKKNAIATSKNYSDEKVASDYLSKISLK
tara:strand:+ start:15306 stop:16499 length:1194 start_codon:yes stop_codon:yes gene_type:complete